MREFLLQEFAGLVIYGSQALVLYFAVRRAATIYAANKLTSQIENQANALNYHGVSDSRQRRAG